MEKKGIYAYMAIPIIFTLVVCTFAASRYSGDSAQLFKIIAGSFFFYSAPYFLWLVVIKIFKASNTLTHAGFIACTASLFLIASIWFLPPDPSGLPIQWMAYWPLSGALMFIFGGVVFVYKYFHT